MRTTIAIALEVSPDEATRFDHGKALVEAMPRDQRIQFVNQLDDKIVALVLAELAKLEPVKLIDHAALLAGAAEAKRKAMEAK